MNPPDAAHVAYAASPSFRSDNDVDNDSAASELAMLAERPLDSRARRLRYEDFATIDWMHDFARERFRVATLRESGSWLANLFDASQAWVLVSAVGCVTGVIAAFIVVAEEWLFDLRSGYCAQQWYLNRRFCCSAPHSADDGTLKAASTVVAVTGGNDVVGARNGAGTLPCVDWVPWASAPWASFCVYVITALAMAFAAAFLVKRLAPYAAGSGIPEVKTILGGFIMRSFLGMWTLVVKAVGLPLATASGMSVGKEGPLVHVACCVGNVFPRMFAKFRNNEAKKREILSAAAAAGVACAFGAPIGGVLFSLEEVSYVRAIIMI